MAITPQSLLLRLRHTDDQASWTRLVAIYEPLLRQWLAGRGLSWNDADDLVQDVLLVVCRRIPEFEHNGQIGAFRTWLKTIVVNRTREFWRSGRLRQLGPGDESLLDQLQAPHSDLNSWWDHEHDRVVSQQMLTQIRQDFSSAVWERFQLLVLENLSGAEVAQRTGASVSAVYAAKSRVLARLRQELANLIDP